MTSSGISLQLSYDTNHQLSQITTTGLPSNDRVWKFSVISLGPSVSLAAGITINSTTVTMTNTVGLSVGMVVTGPSGFPAGTVITSIKPNVSITISKPAVSSGTSLVASAFGLQEAESPQDGNTLTGSASTVYRYDYNSGSTFVGAVNYLLQTVSSVKRQHSPVLQDSVTSKITHTYYPNGHAFQTIDAEGNVQAYQYNTYCNQTTFTDEVGNSTQYFYDGQGRQVRVVWADGSIESDVWSTDTVAGLAGLRTQHTDTLGLVTNYKYGVAGSDDRKLGNVTEADQGKILDYADLSVGANHWQQLTSIDRDATGAIITTPINLITTYAYQTQRLSNALQFSKVSQVIQPSAIANGRATNYVYDTTYGDLLNIKQNNVLFDNSTSQWVVNSDWAITRYQYDQTTGLLLKSTDARGDANQVVDTTTYSSFNSFGEALNVSRWIDATSTPAAESFEYDGHGFLTGYTNANGQTTKYTNDLLGRRLTTTQPADVNGKIPVTTNSYDERGNILTTVDPLHNATTFTYNKRQELVKTTYADNSIATNVYNPVGNVVSQADGNGNVTSYRFDSRNRAVETVLADGSFMTVRNNGLGEAVAQTDARANTTLSSYDQFGRLVRLQLPAANESFTIGSTPVLTDVQPAAVWKYKYDAVGNKIVETFSLLTTENTSDRMTSYFYDSMGHVTKRIDPSPSTGQEANDSPVTRFFYDKVGNLLTTIVAAKVGGNVEGVSKSYDGLNRVTDVDVLDPANPTQPALLTRTIYVYDKVGNLTSMTDPRSKLTTYKYDNLNRRIEEIDPVPNSAGLDPEPDTTYQYDLDGNLISQTLQEVSATSPTKRTIAYLYDSRNRQIQATQTDTDGQSLLSKTANKFDDAGNIIAIIVSAAVLPTDIAIPIDNQVRVVTTRYQYDKRNRRTRSVNALGGTNSKTYDANGNVVQETDAAGNTTLHVYDKLNREYITILPSPTTGRADSNDSPVKISLYNTAGDLVQSKFETLVKLQNNDSFNRQTDYIYDKLHRLTKTILPYDSVNSSGNRAASDFTYDAFGNKTSETAPQKGTLSNGVWSYDTTDKTVLKTTYVYDLLNRVTTSTEHDQGQTTDTSQDHIHDYKYDTNGNLLMDTFRAPDGVSSNILPVLSKTEYVYDALNRQTQKKHYTIVSGATDANTTTVYSWTQSAYDVAGNVVSFTGDGDTTTAGRVTNSSYDGLNRQIDVRDVSSGAILSDTKSRYDGVGNLVSSTIVFAGVQGGTASNDFSRDRTTTFSYDALNRQTLVTDPLGHSTASIYDALSNVNGVVDPLGHLEQFRYDHLNRRVISADARYYDANVQSVTTTSYDEAGNVLTVTDPQQNVVTYTYDQRDRKIKEQKSGLQTNEVYLYDQRGNLAQKTDHDSGTTVYTYDAFGRDLSEKWTNNGGYQETITFAYAGDDQLVSSSDSRAGGTITSVQNSYTYDEPLRRRKTNTQTLNGSGSITQTNSYNVNDDRTQFTVSGTGITSYTVATLYDGMGRELQETQSGSGAAAERADFTYNAAGELSTIVRYASTSTSPTVANTTYAYDNAGRITSLSHTTGTSGLGSYTYDYDAADRVLRKIYVPPGMTQAQAETNTFSYDAADELTYATHPTGQATESYSYDAGSNRTNTGDHTGVWNELTSDGTFSYAYDNEVNRTRKTRIAAPGSDKYTFYAYDHRDRMVGVTQMNSSLQTTLTSEYAYNAFNQRVAKVVDPDGAGSQSSTTEAYFYDGDRLLLARNGVSGAITHRYLDGPLVDQVLADEEANGGGAGTTRWLLADEQESIRAIAQYSAGQTSVVDKIVYDSFGNMTETFTGTVFTHLHGYTGQVRDAETGLGYFKARYYDPRTGGFLTEDSKQDGFNWMIYAGNNPINNTDPTGMSALNPFSTGYGSWNSNIAESPQELAMNNIHQLLNPTPSTSDYSSWSRSHTDLSAPTINGSMYAPSNEPRVYDAWNAPEEDSDPGLLSTAWNAVKIYPGYVGTNLVTAGNTFIEGGAAMVRSIGDHVSTLWNDPAAEFDRLDDAKYRIESAVKNTAVYVAQHPIQTVINVGEATGDYLNRVTKYPEASGQLAGNIELFAATTAVGGAAGELAPEWLVGTSRAGGAATTAGEARATAPSSIPKTYPDGSFSISDWTGYPQGAPRPQGPFRLIEGEEYQAARNAANSANRAIHQADPSLAGQQIHEIQPVKFGGSPTDPANKIPLSPQAHQPFTNWWNALMRSITGG